MPASVWVVPEALLSLASAVAPVSAADSDPESPLSIATRAALFVREHGVETDPGRVWIAAPAQAPRAPSSLYTGSAGIVWFLLELWRSTGDEAWKDEAISGARFLARTLPERADPSQCGLYTGLAGHALAIKAAAEAGLDPELERAAHRALDLILGAGRGPDGGYEWGPSTDVISGTAGVGLMLLHAAPRLLRPDARAAAHAAARVLVSRARPSEHGLFWDMTPGYPRIMPNFSHGTAGVAYFLARAYEETGDRRLLVAALGGARHLLAIADRSGGGCRVHHHTPGGEDLYYLGYCHGPAGTARLFVQLWRVTGDSRWMQEARRAAASIRSSGIPEVRTEGFWDNAGLCCGDAGVLAFFADLYRLTGDERDLLFARRLREHIASRAEASGPGLRWVHAEHRVRPDLRFAQTGLMQGAAGIGYAMLKLRAAERGDRVHGLPDSPFFGP